MNFPVIDSDFNRYIKNVVNKYPPLSEERERNLAILLREQDDLNAAEELVLCNLRAVVKVARDYSGYCLPLEDLIQEGTIGLMQAVKRFDPSRGIRLISFALHYIRASIHEFIVKNWRLVKIATTKSQRKLFFNLRSLRKDFDTMKPEEITDIANKLDVSEDDVMEMEKRFSNIEMTTENKRDDDNYAVELDAMDLLSDSKHEPQQLLEKSESIANDEIKLSKALLSLDDRSRRIIETRWLKNDGEEATLHDLSLEFNVSKERIRQIEQKALKNMQSSFME